ncbi:MAG: hypothetical protein HW406_824 [Candidatus Brocadiaceae bacterium]|nr:hypothetical protein [Candidatus Brocadiaceae bacterium]
MDGAVLPEKEDIISNYTQAGRHNPRWQEEGRFGYAKQFEKDHIKEPYSKAVLQMPMKIWTICQKVLYKREFFSIVTQNKTTEEVPSQRKGEHEDD